MLEPRESKRRERPATSQTVNPLETGRQAGEVLVLNGKSPLTNCAKGFQSRGIEVTGFESCLWSSPRFQRRYDGERAGDFPASPVALAHRRAPRRCKRIAVAFFESLRLFSMNSAIE